MLKYSFYDNKSFYLLSNKLEDIYTFIKAKWAVQEFQIKLCNDKDNIQDVTLTNKLGETFAYIGYLKTL